MGIHVLVAPAHPATLALMVLIVLPVLQATAAHLPTTALLIPVKPLQTQMMMGQMVTSIASMGEI